MFVQCVNGMVDESLLQMDYTASVCLGDYSTQERRQLEDELELSQVIQRALLPQQVPDMTGFDIAGYSRPAQIIGGDYFDFLRFKDGAHGFVVADVSGKGISAGILMTSLQTAFHTIVPETRFAAQGAGEDQPALYSQYQIHDLCHHLLCQNRPTHMHLDLCQCRA